MSNDLQPTSEEDTTEEPAIEEQPRERFIPIGRQDVVADLLADTDWNDGERKQFEEFCQIFTALYHYKFHKNLEELKHSYAPFNPDADLVQREYSKEEKQQYCDTLINEMRGLINNANYEQLTIEAVNSAMNAESYYGVNVSVDMDDFDEMVIYYRGSTTQVKYKRNWKTLFLTEEPIEIPIYQRLFLLLKFKTEADLAQERVETWLTAEKKENESSEELSEPERLKAQEKINKRKIKLEKKARKQIKKSRQNLPDDITEEHIFLKLFKNIPRTDLAMLFPNQNVRLKLFDKIKLAITGGGGSIFGIFSIALKVTAALNPFALIGALGGFIGMIVRQVMSIFTQRTKYMMTLSRNLYFLNLDNNFGVMNYLVDMAEEEEGKEAILAYYFLHINPEKNYTQEELDREIENYIQDKYGVAIDFEVDDGLRKLRKEGLLIEKEGGILKVIDLPDANVCLDKQWDNFFTPEN
jgi:ribosomal protein L9